jgi:hypothetical protein
MMETSSMRHTVTGTRHTHARCRMAWNVPEIGRDTPTLSAECRGMALKLVRHPRIFIKYIHENLVYKSALPRPETISAFHFIQNEHR